MLQRRSKVLLPLVILVEVLMLADMLINKYLIHLSLFCGKSLSPL